MLPCVILKLFKPRFAFHILSAGIYSLVLFSVVLQEPVQVQAEDMPPVPAHSLPLRAGGQGD
jgi:hypothetical protein